MADPVTLKIAGTIIKVASNLGGMDGKDTSFISKLVIGFMLILVLLSSLVYMLLAPVSILFGNSNSLSFKEKYQASVITYADTEQIGIYPLPCSTDYITSPYGTRNDPTTGIGTEFHTGIDFGTAHQSSLVAIADGTVMKIGVDKAFGKHVLIWHEKSGGYFYTLYAHMSKIYVVREQEVKPFQIIGKEGGEPGKDPFPGRSTGHHLHFEIRNNQFAWSHTDPYPYILGPPPPPEEEDVSSSTIE